MRNKGFISPVLLKENIKKNAYLAILAVAVYFISCPLLILIGAGDKNNIIFSALNCNLGFLLTMMVLPLCAAVSSMDFMHKKIKAMNTNSLPFSRTKIFASNILAGWLLCVVPAIIGFLMLIAMDVSLTAAILIGLLETICSLTFLYGLFVLAGSLVGTTVKHVLLSGLFFIIVPMLVLGGASYAENFLPGYGTSPQWLMDIVTYSNPVFEIIVSGKWIYMANTEVHLAEFSFIYFAAGILMLVIGMLLYKRAKLEFIGKSVLFRLFEDMLTWVVAFAGMTSVGFIFYQVSGTKTGLLIGMLVGTLISFIIMKIVIEKTVKIFSKKNLVSIVGFLIVAMIFTSVTVFDITGFSSRMPEKNDIEYAEIMSGEYNCFTDRIKLKDDEAIEIILAMHKNAIINNTWNIVASDRGCNGFDVTYKLKDGSYMHRSFDMYCNDDYDNLVKQLEETKNFTENCRIENLIDMENISSIVIDLNVYDYYQKDNQVSEEVITISDKDAISELIKLADEENLDGKDIEYFDSFNMNVTIKTYSKKDDIMFDVGMDDHKLLNFIKEEYEKQGKGSIFKGLI